VDLVLAVSPPLQAGLAGCVLSWLKAAPLVLQVQDLIPDLAIALGMLRNPWAIRLARKLEGFVYRQSDSVLVICEGFAANLRSKGVPDSKIHQIPHWVDTLSIRPEPPLDHSRRACQIDDSAFLVLHTGNLGAKQKLENVLEAANCLRDLPDVHFCFVGEGTEKTRLEHHARHLGLSNVRFLPLMPRESLPGLLAAADALLLNQAARVVDMVIPSKLLTYLAAGRPVVAAVPPASEAGHCLARAGGGLVGEPENPAQLAAAVRLLYEHRDRARRMGLAARRFAEMHFASDQILPRYEALFASVAAQSRHPRRSV
jgi:colanic acid biosynthesis glycosyl transferase WcaI